MELLTMTMTGPGGILSVPTEHLPGLVVLVVIAPGLWIALGGARALAAGGVRWAGSFLRRYDSLSFTAHAALFGTLVGALVHAAIVPTHWGDERVTAWLFIADTAGFAFAFWLTFTGRRHWRLVDGAMLGGTALAYALYILKGWESADPVGLITTTVELAAALVVLSPVRRPSKIPTSALVADPGSERWIAAAALPLAFLSLLGTAAIAGAAQTPSAMAAMGPAPATKTPSATKPAGTESAGTQTDPPPMKAMGPRAAKKTEALSLPTNSPAGPIVWPDAMTTMAPGMEMATPDCVAQPTSTEEKAAVTLVDQTVAAASVYRSLAAAKAAGYVPLTPTGQKIVHYINPSIYRRGPVLDPRSIPVLVYVNTAHGAVLSAAMYLMPSSAGTKPPQPGGCLTQWHIHDDLCIGAGTVVGNDSAGSCPADSVNRTTPPMMHVWVTPVAGGPLAPDPPARSEITAAAAVAPVSPANAVA